VVYPDDVKALVAPVLGHRLFLAAEARLRGRQVQAILEDIISSIPVPVEGDVGVPHVTGS
jgi:MoxR-like ATPase